ncbi:MAG: hypothetical protein OHK0039_20990 [Bacteroidia bacterium]
MLLQRTYQGHYLSSIRTYAGGKLPGGPTARLRFWWQVFRGYRQADRLMQQTLRDKVCYYGPFKGEFGNFLSYVLPFLSYLHRQGVAIHYCGMALHRPLMRDEAGRELASSFHALRDFFAEVPPNTNSTVPPTDVQDEIGVFADAARRSGAAYWDIGDPFFYWFIQRTWMTQRGYMHCYDLSQVYGGTRQHAVAIFPRRKGTAASVNNGGPWDYEALAHAVSPYFDKVYVVGHPAQSLHFASTGNIEVCISADNAVMLEKCANSSLIITQHSGTTYIGEYTRTPTLIIYDGQPPIGSLGNTLYFKDRMTNLYPFSYAYSMDEVVAHCRSLRPQPIAQQQ